MEEFPLSAGCLFSSRAARLGPLRRELVPLRPVDIRVEAALRLKRLPGEVPDVVERIFPAAGPRPLASLKPVPRALIIKPRRLEDEMKRLLLGIAWGIAALAWAGLPSTVKLDNARLHVTEVTAAPGSVRERGVRAHDQVIVFLDDCRYERTDPQTGAKTIQERKSGDVIWHTQGEDAPQLVNTGNKPYRTVVIELK